MSWFKQRPEHNECVVILACLHQKASPQSAVLDKMPHLTMKEGAPAGWNVNRGVKNPGETGKNQVRWYLPGKSYDEKGTVGHYNNPSPASPPPPPPRLYLLSFPLVDLPPSYSYTFHQISCHLVDLQVCLPPFILHPTPTWENHPPVT